MTSPIQAQSQYENALVWPYAMLTSLAIATRAINSSPAPAEDERSRPEEIKKAICDNDVSRVRSLLKKEPRLLEKTFSFSFNENESSVSHEGLTPLILATRLGHSEIVGALLENKADILAKAKNDESSILELALAHGDTPMAEVILEKTDQELLELRRGFYKWTPLMRMAFIGDLAAVDFLLRHKADAEAVDTEKDTALNLAAIKGHLEVLKRLAAGKEDQIDPKKLQRMNNLHETPLLLAVKYGEVSIAEFLLKEKADPKASDVEGNTALHLAVKNGELKIVQSLLDEQSENTNLLELRNDLGETPYLTAASSGKESVLNLLLKSKADPKARDKNGNTALHLAVNQGSLSIVRLLVGKKKGEPSLSGSDLEFEGSEYLELRNKSGKTPLLVAIQFDEKDIAKFLLDSKANPDARDADGNTALHLAVKSRNIEIVKTLLEYKVDKIDNLQSTKVPEALKRLLETRNTSKETPFLVAAQAGDEEITHHLIDCGAEVEVQNHSGNTALHIAVAYGYLGIVEKILLRKPEIKDSSDLRGSFSPRIEHLRNNEKKTPIELAVENKKLKVVDYLLGEKSNFNSASVDREGIFFESASEGYIKLIKKLLQDNDSLFEKRDKSGKTAIMLAAQKGQLETLDYLLSQRPFRYMAHSDLLQTQDESGNTAIMLAAHEGELKTVDYLLSKNGKLEKGFTKETQRMFLESAEEGYLRILKALLESQDDTVKMQVESECTSALLIASENGKADAVEYLCANGADIKAQDYAGYTPLQNAVWGESVSTVKSLLDLGADQAATNREQRNALHLAWSRNEDIVSLLLADRSDRLSMAIRAQDCHGGTPLCNAIEFGVETVIFKLLESRSYFPQSPAEEEAHVSPEREKELVSAWLMNWIQSRGNLERKFAQDDNIVEARTPGPMSERNHSKSIICWAILNNDPNLLATAVSADDLRTLDEKGDRKGATWLHLAALVGHTAIVDKIRALTKPIWCDSILARAKMGITPIHVAARLGHHGLMLDLLRHLVRDSESKSEELLDEIVRSQPKEIQKKVLQAIIQETDDEENLISLTVSFAGQARSSSSVNESTDLARAQQANSCKQVECQLWNTIVTIIQADTDEFFHFPHTENAELVIKTMIWRDNIRDYSETTELGFLDKMKGVLEIDDPKNWDHLYWAVEKKYPVAVYWFLSSGLDFSAPKIAKCEALTQNWNNSGQRMRLKELTAKRKVLRLDLDFLNSKENLSDSDAVFKTFVNGELEKTNADFENLTRKKDLEDCIERLLKSPPPVRPRKGDSNYPRFQTLIDEDDSEEGTVLEISIADNQITYQSRRDTMYNIIYNGPDDLIKKNEVLGYQSFMTRIFSPAKWEKENSQAAVKDLAKKDRKIKDEQGGSHKARKKVRWIHIPVNNVSIELPLVSVGTSSGMIFSEIG
ncbi:Mg2+ transporter protein CorA-like/Zinc transport protein ZntB [Penicillium malachiteum]|nr:Mg2+ transporter protein CorA-like/Zinc transport protein ZntB [Penicillium malachiteum]